MAQQTAVEWFFDNLKNHEIQSEHYLLYVKAKAMEEELIMQSYIKGAEEAKKIFKEELQEFIVLPKDFTYKK